MSAEHGYRSPWDIISVRSLLASNTELGVGFDDHGVGHRAYFVYDRLIGDQQWHRHCGPYSTFEQAADWIRAISASDDAPELAQ